MVLEANIKAQLNQYMQMIENDIVLKVSAGDDSVSKDMLALVEELASMSSKITVEKAQTRQNAKLQRQSCRRRYRRDIRRGSARSRIHIFGAGTLASKRQTAESRSKNHRSNQEHQRRVPLRILYQPHMPQLPGCCAGIEHDERAQPEHLSHNDRRCGIQVRSRKQKHYGCADRILERRILWKRPNDA